MLRSMYSGISGMKNFQTKLDVIGNNIANVNTAGFKKSRVTFQDAMNQTISNAVASEGDLGGLNAKQVGLGANIAAIDIINSESSVQTTGRALDLAINGDGYFILKNGDQTFYSRAGNLYIDGNGSLVNAEGYKVQAFDTEGNLADININVNSVMPYVPTKNITIPGNLSSVAGTNFVYSQQFEVVNEEGTTDQINMYFKKSSDDTWDVYTNNPETADQDPIMSLTFDEKGNVASYQNSTITTTQNEDGENVFEITLNAADPIEEGETPEFDQDIIVDGQVVNFHLNLNNLKSTVGTTDAYVVTDGNLEGRLDSFYIGSHGEVNEVYSNGQVLQVGTLGIATFSNSAGLSSAGGTLFQETVNSGAANVNVAGVGRGIIATEQLEMSNVDLSEEFTDMIIAQRGFQANTKIITTSDEILQELVNLKR
ncbi:flagellar hook protein FlgE [Caldibacillus lycopersici]|uniref:Flagellar hook protein FlgE n=1 Tax=Perspicuibacillus lycopersici TaxID=1325689 RepID=A0AAE3IP98_9BACI|nr:flagellar hook protein FlgE [Perspicuibacillus lycopersici]MCU9612098.1 flagellar hook protein FlgE [Perspicuibacillus lycopersici]